MTDGPGKVINPIIESTDEQSDQLKIEDVDQLQHEGSEDSTGSEDLRLFLKELHEKVKEDHHHHNQQQQIQQSHVIIPSTGHAQPVCVINPGELPIIGGGGSSTAVTSYHSSQYNLKTNQMIQYQTPGQVTTTADQHYHTSVGELNAHDVVSDGGWGWFVVLGSFCCMVLVDGICFTYGLLINPICPYSNLRVLSSSSNGQKFNETGPIKYPRNDRIIHPIVGSCIPISELGEDFQIQQRSILLTPGGLIVGLYLFLGIGLSFIYLPAIATVGHWFQQKRPLAVGLALCGSGMGCLIGGQAIPRLVSLFTWRGTLIILAAVCFQCLTLILLFRPWDVHFQITQAQHAKRLAREAARRAAALRRAEAERVLLEARRRKYLAALEAAATAHTVGVKKHSNTTPAVMTNNINGNKPGFQCQAGEYRSNSNDSGGGGVVGGRRNTAQYIRIHNTNQTRNGRQNKHFIFNPYNRTQQNPGVMNTRSNAVTGNRSVNHQNHGSSRTANRKRTPSRRVIVYRGSIMQRIIEEKRRQRTISVGSLDGMVITRDNELIAASKIINQDKSLCDPTTIQRISDNVTRKIEAKLSNTIAPKLSIVNGVNINNNNNAGVVVPTSGGTSALGSRTGLRVSLPQLVQEYIQSQVSLSLQQQQSKLSSVANLINNNSMNYGNDQSTPADTFVRSPSVISKLSTVIMPNYDTATVQLVSGIGENSVHLDGGGFTGSKNAPMPSDSNQMIPVNTSMMNSPAFLNGTTNPPPPSTTGRDPVPTRTHPIRSVSETVSLKRTTSEASLTSHFTSIGVVDPHNNNGNIAGADLLDDEMKADIQLIIRKEMSRPQYKKDFFYTGPVRQVVDSSMLSSKQLPISHKLSINLPILPATVADNRPNRSSTAAFRLPSTIIHPDIKLQPEHCSQTNLSIANSSNLFTNQFIPPAPCPSIPLNNQQSIVHNVPLTGLPQFSVPLGSNINQYGANNNSDRIDSVGYINNTESVETSATPLSNQLGLSQKIDCDESTITNAGLQRQQLQEGLIDFGVDIDDGDVGAVELGLDDIDIEDEDDNRDTILMNDDDEAVYTRCQKCFDHCIRLCGSALFCCWTYNPIGLFMQDLLSPKLLSNITFLFFLFSSMMAMLGLVVPFLMLPDLLAEMNWKLEDSGFIISSIGAGNTFGRLFATFYIEKAWSTTYRWADSLWMNNISLLLTSVTVFVLPIVRRYYAALVLISCGFGLFSAVFVSLKSILVVELIGIDRLTNAFGYLLLFQGFAAAVGPPVAGYLRDLQIDKTPPFSISTVYNAPAHNASSMAFIFSASALFTSCLLGCPLRWLSKRGFSNKPISSYNPTELVPNHVDHTNYGYEYNTISPTLPTTDHEYYIQQQQLGNMVSEYQSIDVNCMTAVDPISTSRRVDVVDSHYAVNQPTVVPPSTSLTVIDALKSQTTTTDQLSPSVIPQSSVNCLPISSGHHMIFSTEPASTLAASGIVTGLLDNKTLDTTTNATGTTIPMTDESVSLVNVGGLKLPAAVIPASVVTGGGTVPTPVVSLSLPAQSVEVLEVKEDPGLEPVVEEEEEDYEDDEQDVDQYTRVNQLESGTLLLTEPGTNIDSSIPTSESSFNQDTTGDSVPTNGSSSSSLRNINSRKDGIKHKRRRTSKPFELNTPIVEDKFTIDVTNDVNVDEDTVNSLTACSFLSLLCTFTIDDNYHDDAIVKMPHIIAFIVVTTAAIADATAAIIMFLSVKLEQKMIRAVIYGVDIVNKTINPYP
ncbi:monocarboxylate transporter, putative [Schistosoma mansoni]|uniref:monocarboxylate transporter, putative n=1 Tax=Schistosoma mansoni TaxID=6183 RepID=UPI0001A63A7D|nr:monocarboxylate transporter, putative [Schistosoma mansoni]|eukprot:XP_018645748.1 monocarboxylate transporter, putative [Schistosoma mansoni]